MLSLLDSFIMDFTSYIDVVRITLNAICGEERGSFFHIHEILDVPTPSVPEHDFTALEDNFLVNKT